MTGVMRFVPLSITRLPLIAALSAALLLALARATPPAEAAVPQAQADQRPPRGRSPLGPARGEEDDRAANHIRNRPYRWGGGHRSFNSRGYDCSGSVSYVLHAAGLLDYPLTSGGFMRYGRGGASPWVRIYANDGHVFMVIAGLRWDTSYITDGDRTGPGWSEEMRPTGGFRLRHPVGVLKAG